MEDRLRLLPRDFLEAWIRVFHELPSKDFVSVYETLCEGLYYGFRTKEPWEGKPDGGKRLRSDYFFADASLLRVKERADERLAALAAALRRWEERSASGGAQRPRRSHRLADGPASEAKHPA